ncbi:hypothetical protein HZB93_00780 [Candidatus Falkowbacteria bacterium]|nr:hypothetical protein [Candidatus Falkowbacteria bacterium]
MAQKVTGGLIRDVFLDTIREILYFPVWWYTRGLLRAGSFSWQRIKNMELRLGVKVWVVNIFKPMFGQRDIAGVLISFFMRIFQIIGRTLVLILWTLVMILVFFIWIILPILVILGIILNLAAA